MAAAASPREVAAVRCGLCPDVVEWCPAAWGRDLLAYGTYELDEGRKLRSGALHLASVAMAAEEGPAAPRARWSELAEEALPGVYDVAWGPEEASGEGMLLATAIANGELRLFSVRRGEGEAGAPSLAPASPPCQVLEDHSILTHVAWGAGASALGLAASGQDGSVSHLEVREGHGVTKLAARAVHDMEVWSVEVPPSQPHLVLSGADDSRLAGWDLREPPDAPLAVDSRRSHEAGVTALACDPRRPHLLATGSYDERVRLFDLRALGSKTPIAEGDRLGDGAYHLAWHPEWPGVLAVAAMRSGLPLLTDAGGGAAIREWGRYAADAPEGSHGSLAYGVCWRTSPAAAPAGDEEGGQGDRLATSAGSDAWLAASASFYDRSLHVWSVPAPAAE